MKKFLLPNLLLFTILVNTASPESSCSISGATLLDETKCSQPEFRQFDFWVGEWELTWSDTGKGTNVIRKELGSCVIHENFSDPTGNFFGQSLSVYNADKKQWEQTWVDSQGGYMVFTGEFKDGTMTLSRNTINKKGIPVIQRMVFYNIKPDSLDWSWESSADAGKTWKQNWLIHYKRK